MERMSAIDNLWLRCLRPRPAASVRLVCIHYAGGGSNAFHHWPRVLPDDIEAWAVQLPGRGWRWNEPPVASIGPAVEAISDAITHLVRPPFAIFGHSMGALLGFEVSRRLAQLGRPKPIHLFASAFRSPHVPDPHPPVHKLPDRVLLDRLHQFGGTPPQVLE